MTHCPENWQSHHLNWKKSDVNYYGESNQDFDNATDFSQLLYKYKVSRMQTIERGKKLLFFLCMQRFLSLKEKNSTLLILLRFVFWVLFSVEESASPQLISIKVEEMKVHHYNHDTGGETFFVAEYTVFTQILVHQEIIG